MVFGVCQVGNSVVLLVQVLDVITFVNVKLLLLGIIKGTTVTTAMKAPVRKDVQCRPSVHLGASRWLACFQP